METTAKLPEGEQINEKDEGVETNSNHRPLCQLLQLPREIRDLIYEVGDLLPHYLMLDVCPDERHHYHNRVVCWPSFIPLASEPNTRTLVLFWVCKQLRAEALEFLGSQNYFNILFYPDGSLPPQKLPNIKTLLQEPFKEILANIRFLRVEIMPGFISFYGSALADHLVQFAPRLERLAIVVSGSPVPSLEKNRLGARCFERLLDIPSLKVLKLLGDLRPITRRLGQAARCRVEFICGCYGNNGPFCSPLLESPEPSFIKKYRQDIDKGIIAENKERTRRPIQIPATNQAPVSDDPEDISFGTPLFSRDFHVGEDCRRTQWSAARFDRYQVLGVILQPTAGLTGHHTVFAFEEGHEV